MRLPPFVAVVVVEASSDIAGTADKVGAWRRADGGADVVEGPDILVARARRHVSRARVILTVEFVDLSPSVNLSSSFSVLVGTYHQALEAVTAGQ